MPTIASAASSYDDAVRVTNNLEIDNSGYVGSKDITQTWQSVLMYGGSGVNNTGCSSTIRDTFITALKDGNLAVVQKAGGVEGKKVIVSWRVDKLGGTDFDIEYIFDASGNQAYRFTGSSFGFYSAQLYQYGDNQYGVVCYAGRASDFISNEMGASSDFDFKVFLSNFPITYPAGYEGAMIPTEGLLIDSDSDGLRIENELIQGTSDDHADTDGDGIDDFTESQWNPDRNDIFCNKTTSPYTCAYPNPTKKDIYVEVDWMKDPATNRLLKPSTTQLGILTGMYAPRNINFHFDTGQYGGGNQLPDYINTLTLTATPSITDFGDLKASHFASNRETIWRYMVYGYHYAESPGSSGRAEVSGDDIFVSGGLIEDNPSVVNEDRAVAGTMAHEIGHTLCLSDEQKYPGQPAGCIYDSIDSTSFQPENYKSVMNYRYQLTTYDDMGGVDYSDGTHGAGDHNDWSAVLSGMEYFNKLQTASGAKLAYENKAMDPARLSKPGASVYGDGQQEQEGGAVDNEPSIDNDTTHGESMDKANAGNLEEDNTPSAANSQNRTTEPGLLPAVGIGIAVIGVGGVAWWRLRRKK